MTPRNSIAIPAMCIAALLAGGPCGVLAQQKPAAQTEAPRAEPPHQAPSYTPPPPPPPPQHQAPSYTPPPPPQYTPPAQQPQREAPRFEPQPQQHQAPQYTPPAQQPQREAPRFEPQPQQHQAPQYTPPAQQPQREAPRFEAQPQQHQTPQYTPPAQQPQREAPRFEAPQQVTPRYEPSTQTPRQQTPGDELRRVPAGTGSGTPNRPGAVRPSPSDPAPAPAATGSRATTPRIPHPVYSTVAAAVASHTANGDVLNASGSNGVLQQVNASRIFMRGINNRPLPPGVVTIHQNGNLTVKTTNGAQFYVRKTGSLASVVLRSGTVNFRPSGGISAVRTPATDILRGVHGERIVVARRPDHSTLVSTGPGRGFIERAAAIGNRAAVQRTYVAPGRLYTRAYMGYSYRGLALRRFLHPAYHSPAYYRWARHPWASTIFYRWSWFGEAWCGYYGAYFQPYYTYPDAGAWLTDYVLAQTLSDGYSMESQAQPMAGYDADVSDLPPDEELYAAGDSIITPDVKAALAEEIDQQLKEEEEAASGPEAVSAEELGAVLKPGRLFVASSVLDVQTPDQRSCELTPGDILRLITPPAGDATVAGLDVIASKRRDCPAGTRVEVSLQDLADMLNDMRAQLDAGLELLRNSASTGGLPFAPSEAISDEPKPAIPGLAPAPIADAAALLDAQRQAAGAIEAAAVQALPIER